MTNYEALATVREALENGIATLRLMNCPICANHLTKAIAALDTLSAAQVPDGWQLVPKEPTKEMTDAGAKEQDKYHALMFHWNALNVFRAMIAAAPQVPEKCAIGWGEAKHYGPPDSMGICHPIENSTAPQVSGDVETCKICNKKCEPLAANPMLWPVRLLGKEGTTDCYHQGCIATERLASDRLREALKACRKDIIEQDMVELDPIVEIIDEALAAQPEAGK